MIRALRRRLLLLLVSPAILVLTGAAATATPAPAGGWEAPVTGVSVPRVTPAADRVVIVPTTVSPSVVNRGTPVRITGTVTARTGVPLSGARVRVVTDPTTLTRREAVTAWAGSQRPGRGRVVAERVLPAVPAGQTTSFVLDLPAGAVSSPETFAALPISVEVVPAAGATPSGVVHSFLAWHTRKEYIPIRVATILPLTLDADVDLYSRDDATRTAAWAEHLGPGSRVERIVEGSAGGAVTLAVDPSLFGPEPAASSEGAPPTSPTTTSSGAPSGAPATSQGGSTPTPAPATPAPASTAASTPTGTAPSTPATSSPGSPPATTAGTEALVDGLASRLGTRDVWALPYADADLAATLDVAPGNPLVRDLVERSSLVGTRLARTVRTNVFWPVDGTFATGRDKGLKALVASTGIRQVGGVVVSADAITVDGAYTPSAVRVSPAGTRLLAFDNALSALLPERGTSAALATQQFLADSLALLGERPGTERSLLLAAPRDYDPDAEGLASFLRAVDDADWLTPVGADALVTEPARTPLVQQNPKPPPAAIASPPVLTKARLAAMAEQRETLLQVATVLRDGAAFEATYREVLDELASSRWRSAQADWQQLSDSVVADTKSATSAIKVVPQGVNFLAAQGILRITVSNGLDYTIEGIRLVVEPTNPRMTVEQPEPITIGPGAMTTVRVPATALAAGRVDIRAYLTTADGTPIGQPAIMRVSANPLDSTFYWVGAGLVGLVLLFGVVRTIRKGTSRVDAIGDLEAVAAEVERMEEGEQA